MRQFLVFVPVFVAGVVLGAFALSDIKPGGAADDDQVRMLSFETEGEYQRLEEMIQSLGDMLDAEVTERQRVERELHQLAKRLDAIDLQPRDAGVDAPPASERAEKFAERAVNGREMSEERLVEAGFAVDEAARLKQQADEIAMQRLYLRDQAMREGWLGSGRYREELRALGERQQSMRDQLSADDYDRYLWALGRPNRVTVSSVLSGSPAQQAGLQPGDQILSYAGERVFSPGEIRRESSRGVAGASVAVEVMRDSQPMLVYLPRGPLGVQMTATVTKP